MTDVTELRANAPWQKHRDVYWFSHGDAYVVWECAVCGKGADSRTGHQGIRGILEASHSCPGAPETPEEAERVEYMAAHGRPNPEL